MRYSFAMEKHQRNALLIFVAVLLYMLWRDGRDESLVKALVLFIFLAPILFYRFIAWLASFGFPEYFARDFGGENHPGPYAFFFWLLYL
ncbi:MAG: hypothetical protein KJP03_06930, partial [Gammaproteobacteria bacterium]|nr:hypothetical protein [Gammaproteobacteria bacterium]